jgi:hypothetical protein
MNKEQAYALLNAALSTREQILQVDILNFFKA